jgi:hypothetical protein
LTQFTLDDGIMLLSGVMFNYDKPEATEHIYIDDLALPLSHICRFAGQLPYFYSVAQHLVNASRIVAPEHAFEALMHDTAEAFTNDIVTPLKARAGSIFKEIEVRVEADMARRFGFNFPMHPDVKIADTQMLGLEMRYIRKQDTSKHKILNDVEFDHLLPLVDLAEWTPRLAFRNWMLRYEELKP